MPDVFPIPEAVLNKRDLVPGQQIRLGLALLRRQQALDHLRGQLTPKAEGGR